jgi:hypothetical protein
MKRKAVHIRWVALALLVAMLKVAFPLGEYFHDHHSDEELCAHATGTKCHHKAHFAGLDQHHDCIFVQLHHFFTPSFYLYQFFEQSDSFAFFFRDGEVLHFYPQTSARAPPFLMYNA